MFLFTCFSIIIRNCWNNGCNEEWWFEGGSRGVVLGVPDNLLGAIKLQIMSLYA